VGTYLNGAVATESLTTYPNAKQVYLKAPSVLDSCHQQPISNNDQPTTNRKRTATSRDNAKNRIRDTCNPQIHAEDRDRTDA